MINNIQNNTNQTALNGLNNATDVQTTSVAIEDQGQVYSVPAVDSFEKTADTGAYSGTYTPSENMSTEAIDIDALQYERMASFQNMISQMAGEQIDAFTSSTYSSDFLSAVSPEASADALASISEGGQYSAENVANDILNMAKALSDGDDSKFELLKEAVIKGFSAAADAWGGEMPGITNETYDLVMEGFDAWEAEINGVAEAAATTVTATATTATTATTPTNTSATPKVAPNGPPPPPPGRMEPTEEVEEVAEVEENTEVTIPGREVIEDVEAAVVTTGLAVAQSAM